MRREEELDATPPAWSGQTGRRGEISDDRRTQASVRAGAHRVVLESAGYLERLQTLRRQRKNNRWRLEKLGFEEKGKEIKSRVCIDFDRLDPLNRP